MSFTAAVFAALTFTLHPESGLRLANPNDVPVEATLRCGAASRTVQIDAGGLTDVAQPNGCTELDARLPLVAYELVADEGEQWQRRIGTDAGCGSGAMAAPLFACKSGVASAYVEPVEGATYAWTIQGGTIISGADTPRVTVQLTSLGSAKLTATVTTSSCSTIALGTISVRDPILIKTFVVPAMVNANEPVTIFWTYEPGTDPTTQLLTGDAFAQPVALTREQRSYTFTPRSSGTRSLELRATHAASINLGPKKKRRASAGSAVSVSDCPSARAQTRMDVRGCTDEGTRVDAPEDTPAGSTFSAFVNAEAGETVKWEVDHGTVVRTSASEDQVEIMAGSNGPIRIRATVARKNGCSAFGEATVYVLQPLAQCATPPRAVVEYLSHDCRRATVLAKFTGTGPFAGEWSDGTPFRTSGETFVLHDFENPGTFSLGNFRDSTCYGTVEGTPSLPTLKPIAQLQASYSCGYADFVATFTGVPPFSGSWRDGVPYTTTEHRLERNHVKIDGDYELDRRWTVSVQDAACATRTMSNELTFPQAPYAYSGGQPVCQRSATSPVDIEVSLYGAPPYVVEWSDGYVSAPQSYNVVRRTVPPIAEVSRDYTVVRAAAGACDNIEIRRATTTVLNRPTPVINPSVPRTGCAGVDLTAQLQNTMPSNANVVWTAHGDSLVHYEGAAQTVTFTKKTAGILTLVASATYADGFCPAQSAPIGINFIAPGTVDTFTVSPATIAKGQSAFIHVAFSGIASTWTIEVPPDRAAGLTRVEQGGHFLDTVGPGVVPITLKWTDCAGSHSRVINLTIVP